MGFLIKIGFCKKLKLPFLQTREIYKWYFTVACEIIQFGYSLAYLTLALCAFKERACSVCIARGTLQTGNFRGIKMSRWILVWILVCAKMFSFNIRRVRLYPHNFQRWLLKLWGKIEGKDSVCFIVRLLACSQLAISLALNSWSEQRNCKSFGCNFFLTIV